MSNTTTLAVSMNPQASLLSQSALDTLFPRTEFDELASTPNIAPRTRTPGAPEWNLRTESEMYIENLERQLRDIQKKKASTKVDAFVDERIPLSTLEDDDELIVRLEDLRDEPEPKSEDVQPIVSRDPTIDTSISKEGKPKIWEAFVQSDRPTKDDDDDDAADEENQIEPSEMSFNQVSTKKDVENIWGSDDEDEKERVVVFDR